ncbi:unnamed protein product [Moneuplotes crassus]|uniref:Kinesin motor domain-containing protein n=1 Tax=Euplotes crassus TaxID=5936 RepID=A0AAD2D8L2_EUPCR|nr:unnamed protein product [Moneuplotes crassus]
MTQNPIEALGQNLDLIQTQFPQLMKSLEENQESQLFGHNSNQDMENICERPSLVKESYHISDFRDFDCSKVIETSFGPSNFGNTQALHRTSQQSIPTEVCKEPNCIDHPYCRYMSNIDMDVSTKFNLYQSFKKKNHNFKVCVRIRPLAEDERRSKNSKKDSNICLNHDEYSIKLKGDKSTYDYAGKNSQGFYYDYVFGSPLKNQHVFEQSLLPMLPNIFEGFNVTCMAYGITGAGKTYTMLGNTMNQTHTRQSLVPVKGISELAMDYIFDFINLESTQKSTANLNSKNNVQYKIKISYLEVYNEQIRDLLREDKGINLIILEDAQHGMTVPGLKECEVKSSSEVLSLINKGNNRRTMASTHSNRFSSRSHAIIQISMERTQFLQEGATNEAESASVYSKLTLVDLAGSEKEDQEDCVQNKHRLEGSNINKSLLALGNCIKILSQLKSKAGKSNHKGKFVPYRDSKLTRLLKDSLGGNTKTLMLACVSPSYSHYEETLNTLKYAARARKIQNPAKRNVKSQKKSIAKVKKLIGELKMEIISIKTEIKKVQECEEPKNQICIVNTNRRNSFIEPNNYNFDSEDFLEILSYTKSACLEKKRLKTLKKFLKYELGHLIKSSEMTKEEHDIENKQQEIENNFQNLIISMKDRVRLAHNRKEITDAMAKQTNEDAAPYNVNLENLLEENTSALDTNLEKTEGLVNTLKSLRDITDEDNNKENQENLDFYNSKRVELKKQNTDLKEYLAQVKSKYSDDSEIQSLEAQKAQLKSMIAQKTKAHSDVQTNIHIVDSEIRETRKKAAGTINSLVIHFQTDILQKMKDKIDKLNEEQIRRSQLKLMEEQAKEQIENIAPEADLGSKPSRCICDDSNRDDNQEENPFEIYLEQNDGMESPKTRKQSTPLKLKGSFLQHEVKADIEEEQIEFLQKEKEEFQIELQKVKEREVLAQIERKRLQQELIQMQKNRIEEERQFQKDTIELENLRKMREEVQKDYEKQIELQNEIDEQIEAERKRKQELKELADNHILSNYLKEMDIENEEDKDETSRKSLCSLPSQDKSDSDDYSSLVDDIRTVYELQDEETLTQNEVETVIKKPTPAPDSEDSSESFEREGDNSIGLHERSSFEDIEGLEKTLSNLCPQFPINYVSKPSKRSPKKDCDTFIEKNTAINNLNESFLRCRMSSIHKSGKSFGSKCYSQKVSPKMSPKAHTLRLDNSDFGSFCSQSPTDDLKKTQKEIIIENLNSFSSKSGNSMREKESLIASPMNQLRITYLSDKFKDSDKESRKITKQKNFSEVNLLAPSLMNGYPRNGFSPTSSRKQAAKMYEPLKPLQKVSEKHVDIQSFKDPNKVKKQKKLKRNGRRKNRTRSKKFRELSSRGQFKYRGRTGFALIKKYRSKRRIESLKLRENSLGQRKIDGSSRSRNCSEEGFFETIKSQSSDCPSIPRSKSSKKSMPGIYTSKKLNEKFRQIKEAKNRRIQNTMQKIMKIHAHHDDQNQLSRKSSNAFCESVNLNNQSSNKNCKHCIVSSGTVSHQQSSERNFNFDTPKVSISDHDCVHGSRNRRMHKNMENYSRKDSECDFSNPEEIKSYSINSHGKLSPKSISEASKRNTGCRTQKPSFIEQKDDLHGRTFQKKGTKNTYNRQYLMPVSENPGVTKEKHNQHKISNKTTTYHTSTSSMNQNQKIYFESKDLYAVDPK